MKHKPLTTTQAIQMATCLEFDLSADRLTGPCRTKQCVRPRFVAMKITRDRTHLSYPQIGRRYGNRDHTTVMKACERAEELIKKDEDFRERFLIVDRAVEAYIKEHRLTPQKAMGHFKSKRTMVVASDRCA